MRELLKRLAGLEPETYAFFDGWPRDTFSFRYTTEKTSMLTVFCTERGWTDQAWLLTGALLDEMPYGYVGGNPRPSMYTAMWWAGNERGGWSDEFSATTPHEAVLRAYIAYKETAGAPLQKQREAEE